METHRSAARVQEAGCWALKVLAMPGRNSFALSGSSVVTQAMLHHPHDEAVQKAAHLAMRSLSASSRGPRIYQHTHLPDASRSKMPSATWVQRPSTSGLAAVLE